MGGAVFWPQRYRSPAAMERIVNMFVVSVNYVPNVYSELSIIPLDFTDKFL
jgi:hypothetical protein